MATKGQSNQYGNSRGTPTNHINYKYAKDFNRNTIARHFSEHGKEVGATSKWDYIAKAIKFANSIDRKKNESFIDEHGSTYKYQEQTNRFAIIDKNGIIITYFKPKDGRNYYENQKKLKGRKNKHD